MKCKDHPNLRIWFVYDHVGSFAIFLCAAFVVTLPRVFLQLASNNFRSAKCRETETVGRNVNRHPRFDRVLRNK